MRSYFVWQNIMSVSRISYLFVISCHMCAEKVETCQTIFSYCCGRIYYRSLLSKLSFYLILKNAFCKNEIYAHQRLHAILIQTKP